jgi:hypothetical protein
MTIAALFTIATNKAQDTGQVVRLGAFVELSDNLVKESDTKEVTPRQKTV